MHAIDSDLDVRPAFPAVLTSTQLGPTVTPGVCAYAPREGCGIEPARFYLGGWRCGKHGPRGFAAASPIKTAGAES